MSPMTKSDIINEYAEFNELDMLSLGEDFEGAVLGLAEHWTREGTRAEHICYSKQGIIESLMKGGLSEAGAWEYAEFNIFCAYWGPGTPVYVDQLIDVAASNTNSNRYEDLFGDGMVLVSGGGAE